MKPKALLQSMPVEQLEEIKELLNETNAAILTFKWADEEGKHTLQLTTELIDREIDRRRGV